MTEPLPIRVLLVDDHAVVRSGLAAFLLAFDDLELVGEADSGEKALVLCERTRPDVVSMDLVMPGMDGVATTQTIRQRWEQAARVLVEAARPANPHVVFPGNTWGFGKPARLPITPETPFNPPSAVARIKAQVDGVLMGSGLPVTVVHLPDFYGPNVVNPLLRPLFENALAGKDVTFPGPVDMPHPFIYIDDAARALTAVAGQEVCYGRRYTVGGVESITVCRFAEMIYRTAGTQGRVRGMPLWLLRLLGLVSAEARAGAGMMHTFAWDVTMDGTALQHDTGFTPQVGYAEGIACTVEWFRML